MQMRKTILLPASVVVAMLLACAVALLAALASAPTASAASSSTYDTMSATGATTTCSRPEDTAGYWIPTVSWKDTKGTQTTLTANRAVFYYRAGNKYYKTVQPFAP